VFVSGASPGGAAIHALFGEVQPLLPAILVPYLKLLVIADDAIAGVHNVGLRPEAWGHAGKSETSGGVLQQVHHVSSLARTMELDEAVVFRVSDLSYGRHAVLEVEHVLVEIQRLVMSPSREMAHHREVRGIQNEEACRMHTNYVSSLTMMNITFTIYKEQKSHP
jgi:hypothetical protein